MAAQLLSIMASGASADKAGASALLAALGGGAAPAALQAAAGSGVATAAAALPSDVAALIERAVYMAGTYGGGTRGSGGASDGPAWPAVSAPAGPETASGVGFRPLQVSVPSSLPPGPPLSSAGGGLTAATTHATTGATTASLMTSSGGATEPGGGGGSGGGAGHASPFAAARAARPRLGRPPGAALQPPGRGAPPIGLPLVDGQATGSATPVETAAFAAARAAARLARQQVQNKAAQKRYRQRRKERMEAVTAEAVSAQRQVGELQAVLKHNVALQEKVLDLEADVDARDARIAQLERAVVSVKERAAAECARAAAAVAAAAVASSCPAAGGGLPSPGSAGPPAVLPQDVEAAVAGMAMEAQRLVAAHALDKLSPGMLSGGGGHEGGASTPAVTLAPVTVSALEALVEDAATTVRALFAPEGAGLPLLVRVAGCGGAELAWGPTTTATAASGQPAVSISISTPPDPAAAARAAAGARAALAAAHLSGLQLKQLAAWADDHAASAAALHAERVRATAAAASVLAAAAASRPLGGAALPPPPPGLTLPGKPAPAQAADPALPPTHAGHLAVVGRLAATLAELEGLRVREHASASHFTAVALTRILTPAQAALVVATAWPAGAVDALHLASAAQAEAAEMKE